MDPVGQSIERGRLMDDLDGVEFMLRAVTLVAFVLMAAAVFGLLAWAV